MKWREFLIEYLRNVLRTIALASAVLGALGYAWAGMEGLKNALGWVLVFTLFSVPMNAFILIYRKYWGEFAGRYSSWYIKKETEGEAPSDPRRQATDKGWPRKPEGHG